MCVKMSCVHVDVLCAYGYMHVVCVCLFVRTGSSVHPSVYDTSFVLIRLIRSFLGLPVSTGF